MFKILNKMVTRIIFTILFMSLFQVSIFSQDNKNAPNPNLNNYRTGAIPLNAEDLKKIRETFIKARHVKPNSIGLERANKVRKSRGLSSINPTMAAPLGYEVPGTESQQESALSADSNVMLAQSALPASIDNSQMPCFPPIGNQGGIGSCVAFASTYYQLTYMYALTNGYNINHLRIFSPKWTYNLLNAGKDLGSNYIDVLNLFTKHGCATWDEFPYASDGSVPQNYLEWPTNSTVWRNALNYRIDRYGYVDLGASIDDPTPITSSDDPGLNEIKQLLSNGYILAYETALGIWDSTFIKNDPATSADDKYFNKIVFYRVHNTEKSAHEMVVVGYDDTIWTDINGNGSVDPGEKGAFRVANSWGTGWGENGFGWLAYDALNRVTSVSGWTDISSEQRRSAWTFNLAFWFIPKVAYTPKVTAEVTLNHAARNQLSLAFDYTDVSQSTTPIIWKPFAVNFTNGSYAFDGSTTACDTTFVFDLTPLNPDNSLNDGIARRWHFKIADTSTDGKQAILKSFSITDVTNGNSYNSINSFPMQFDGYSGTSWVDCAFTLANLNSAAWSIGPEMTNGREEMIAVGLNGKVYTIGGYDTANRALNTVDMLNTSENKWYTAQPMLTPKWGMRAAALNGKIYVVGGYGPPFYNTIEEYTPETNQWVSKAPMSFTRSTAGVAALNGKLYVAGGRNADTFIVTNSLDIFDPITNIWTSKSGMITPREKVALAAANNKIYAIAGLDNNGSPVRSFEEYDPAVDKWTLKTNFPLGITNIENAVSVDGKIYLLVDMMGASNAYNSLIYQYDPLTDTWSVNAQIPTVGRIITTMAETNGKIYVLGGLTNRNEVSIYNPNWASNTTTPTPTPTPTSTPTATPTNTPTPTPTNQLGCASPTAISVPFTKDGSGEFCWSTATIGNYINSWNLTLLEVNGVNLTNKYVAANSLPAKQNGLYFIHYIGSYSWCHFEAR